MTLFTRFYIQAKEAARRLGEDERGATAIEYGLIAALISVAIIGALTTVGDEIVDLFETIETELTGVETGN